MEQPIVVKFRWSAEDLLQGYRCHQCLACRRPFRILFGATIYGLAFLSVFAGIISYWHGELIPMLFILFPGIALCRLLWPFLQHWLVRRQFAKRPDQDMEIEWQIMPNNLSVKDRHGHGEFCWDAIVQVVRTPSGLMLYKLENMFHYLPRRGFASDAEFEQITELAKSKVRKFRFVT